MREFEDLSDECGDQTSLDHELYASRRRKRNLEWDGTTLKSVRTDRDGGAGLRIKNKNRFGFAYSNLADLDVRWLIQQAEANQRLISPDPHKTLSDAPKGRDFSNQWFDDSVLEPITSRQEKITSAIRRKMETEDVLANLQVEYEERIDRFELYRDNAFTSGERKSSFGLSAWAVCEDDGDVQSGYHQQTCYTYGEIDIENLLDEAIEYGRQKLGATPPESQTGAVLLNPRAASGLMHLVKDMLDGDSVARGRSAWGVDRLGEDVGHETVTIIDHPERESGASNRTYCDEGHDVQQLVLIDSGTLNHFLTNQYVSNRLEIPNNYRASRSYASRPKVSCTNFYLQPGERSSEQLQDELDTGPVITDIQPGSGLDPISGHFSVGASGYFVRNGKKSEPFNEATLSGEVEDLLGGVLGVGDDLMNGYGVAAPSLLVDKLSLGGSD